MLYSELKELLLSETVDEKDIPTPEVYESIIEPVYMYHPSIDDVKGKKQIAELYERFGITIFKDMLKRAKNIEKIETEIRHHHSMIENLKSELNELR